MYKFGQIKIESKKFNSVYEIADKIDLEKIRVSEGLVANKHDTRYTIGYEVELGKIIPLYMKTPKDCASSGVSRYNESSPWKMGFNVGEDKEWVQQYKAVWDKIEDLMFQKLTGTPLSNGVYINSKLITWDGKIRTKFFQSKLECKPEEIDSCYATGILKIGSVYMQGTNYYLQVFLKECKCKERDVSFMSQLGLDEDEDEGYDTIY